MSVKNPHYTLKCKCFTLICIFVHVPVQCICVHVICIYTVHITLVKVVVLKLICLQKSITVHLGEPERAPPRLHCNDVCVYVCLRPYALTFGEKRHWDPARIQKTQVRILAGSQCLFSPSNNSANKTSFRPNFAFKYFTKLKRPCVLSRWRLLPECSIGNLMWRQLKMKHAWQLTCGLYTYQPSTAGCSQQTVVEVASGKGHA